MNLGQNADIRSCITNAAGVAGTSAITGSTIDMQGYESVMFILQTGDITSAAVTSMKVQSGAASNMSDVADLLGTSQTIADTDDNKIFATDLIKPLERYVRLYVSRATQNAACSAIAILYGPKVMPVTQTQATLETHISPAEGTA